MVYPNQLPIKNHLNDGCYYLCRADSICNSLEVREQITTICNQPLIYETLFRENMKGQVYTTKNADEFLNWAKAGWVDNSYYVFFLINKNSEIIACLDIKSSNLLAAEIGYWCSKDYPGIMTNSVMQMCAIGFELGFTQFVAYVKLDNRKSQNVLLRAGFKSTNDIVKRAGYLSYEKVCPATKN